MSIAEGGTPVRALYGFRVRIQEIRAPDASLHPPPAQTIVGYHPRRFANSPLYRLFHDHITPVADARVLAPADGGLTVSCLFPTHPLHSGCASQLPYIVTSVKEP